MTSLCAMGALYSRIPSDDWVLCQILLPTARAALVFTAITRHAHRYHHHQACQLPPTTAATVLVLTLTLTALPFYAYYVSGRCCRLLFVFLFLVFCLSRGS